MADELFCCERLQPELPRAQRDPVIFSDLRVLTNLLYLEKQYVPCCNYFTAVQTSIKPYMRQIVGTWMLEVCEELETEDQVFPIAVNLLDRFLACCAISKQHLQLAASVCIMLATKIRQCQNVKPSSFCYYADHSFSADDLKDWELLILSKLQWNLTSVTAHDFVEHLIERVGLSSEHFLIRRHAITLVGVCYTDPRFVTVPPSVMAAACLASAARGLRTPSSSSALESICALLGDTRPETVEPIIRRIEQALESETYGSQGLATPHKRSTVDSQPYTPTDVSDIHF